MLYMKWLILLFVSFSAWAKEMHPVTHINQWLTDEKELTAGRFFKYATLATVSADGRPHTCMIEISKLSPKEGALFFTDHNTEKVQQIAFHPYGALNLWLPRTHRQISIEGTITQVAQDLAEKAWKQMPRFIKLNFLASSHKEYPQDIPHPPSFIGYQFIPTRIIFYEATPHAFPTKEVAFLKDNQWDLEYIQ